MSKDLLPQEIAEKLGPSDYVKVCSKVEEEYKQRFGVDASANSIKRVNGKIIVTVNLEDDSQHTVVI